MSKFIQGGDEAMTNDADVSPLHTVTGYTPSSSAPFKTNTFLDSFYRNEYDQLAIHNQAGQYCLKRKIPVKRETMQHTEL